MTVTHRMSGTRTYRIWGGMLNRCNNPRNSYYGGRGIKVCKRWFTFENFLAYMGEAPTGYSIERIKNNGNYEPGNCEWIPLKDQAKNKRNVVKVNGLTLPDLSKVCGVKYATLKYRVTHGVPIDKPVGRSNIFTFCGRTMNQKEWAKHLGILPSTLSMRLKKGWPIERVLSNG